MQEESSTQEGIPVPGFEEVYAAADAPLTREEAKASLDAFVATPEISSVIENFSMEGRITGCDESPIFKAARENAEKVSWAARKEYQQKTAEEAAGEVAETLEFPVSHQSLLASIQFALDSAQKALKSLERALKTEQENAKKNAQLQEETFATMEDSVTLDA